MLLSSAPSTCPRNTDFPFNEGEIIEWFGADSLPPCKRIDTEPSNSLLCEENDLKDKTEKTIQ